MNSISHENFKDRWRHCTTKLDVNQADSRQVLAFEKRMQNFTSCEAIPQSDSSPFQDGPKDYCKSLAVGEVLYEIRTDLCSDIRGVQSYL